MIKTALILVIASCILCVIGLILVLFFHWKLMLKEKKAKNFRTTWNPILIQEATGRMAENLPLISQKEKYALLLLWNSTQEQLRGQASETLNLFAKKLELDQLAFNELRCCRGRRHWHAAIALGHLRDPRAIPVLKQLLKNSNPTLSLLAVRALMQIDSEQCLKEIAPLLKSRQDWSRPRIAMILDLAGIQLLKTHIEPSILAQFYRAKIS